MKLRTKFNLILLVVFAIGYVSSLIFIKELLRDNAQEEVLHNAELIMESAEAIRHYTSSEVRGLLIPHMSEKFLPQSVPTYAVLQSLTKLREKYPDYSYKDATLNPTNPLDRANDWEVDIVEWFKNNATKEQYSGIRQTATGPALYLSHPIKITDSACLICHSTPQIAPPSMIAHYGESNGFGWKLNDIVGAQIVSVPMTVPLNRADETLKLFSALLAAIFAMLMIVANIILEFVVIRPVKAISQKADMISQGDLEVSELKVTGNDEIAVLAQSFNRMHRSLANAMKILERTGV